jgi:hypothetical protein
MTLRTDATLTHRLARVRAIASRLLYDFKVLAIEAYVVLRIVEDLFFHHKP